MILSSSCCKNDHQSGNAMPWQRIGLTLSYSF